jgi:hypothetical protein
MQHLGDYGIYGDNIPVPLLKEWCQCCPSTAQQRANGHGYRLKDFKSFPVRHGWTLNNDFTLERIHKTPEEEAADRNKPSLPLGKIELLQSWLFFGLLISVVRTDEATLVRTETLVKNKNLDTKDLPVALENWYDYERINKKTAKWRLIRADLCLELARQVVRANLVDRDPRSLGIGASAEDASVVALSLMVLGETLSAVKEQITEGLDARVNGWHQDDDSGWGPPSHIFDLMKRDQWCLRTIQLLRTQLGSSATLLLAAWKHHGQPRVSKGEAHRNCNEQKCCYVIDQTDPAPAQEEAWLGIDAAPEELQREKKVKYPPQHHDLKCKCKKLFGPDMKTLFTILRDVNAESEGEMFPIFRIQYDCEKEIIGVEVEPWARDSRRSIRKPAFATISHVWAQGLGNSFENKLRWCQLKYIQDLLSSLKTPGKDETKSRSAPFWLDTFAIPVRENEGVELPDDFRTLKGTAMRQIQHVYREALHAVVIDRDLDSFSGPAEASMKILTCAWMRRLWTLQEAFLSKQLSVPFHKSGSRSDHDQAASSEEPVYTSLNYDLHELDTIFEELDVVDHNSSLKTAIFRLAKRRLHQGIMGEERDAMRRNTTYSVKNYGTMLIANAWRSVRWRVRSYKLNAVLFLLSC